MKQTLATSITAGIAITIILNKKVLFVKFPFQFSPASFTLHIFTFWPANCCLYGNSIIFRFLISPASTLYALASYSAVA